MNIITINTGVINIPINRNGEEVGAIAFNPEDVKFVTKFFSLISVLEKKDKEMKLREEVIKKDKTVSKNRIPNNSIKKLELYEELCAFMEDELDKLFGDGTCQMLFAGVYNTELYIDFLHQLIPIIEEKREDKLSKYVSESTDILE